MPCSSLMKTCWNLFDKSTQGFLTFLWGDTPPIETPCLDLALRLAIIHLVHEWRLNAIKQSMTCVPVLNRLDDDWMQSMRRFRQTFQWFAISLWYSHPQSSVYLPTNYYNGANRTWVSTIRSHQDWNPTPTKAFKSKDPTFLLVLSTLYEHMAW